MRDRTCASPLHGGTECEGPASEIEACNEDPCPGKYSNMSFKI